MKVKDLKQLLAEADDDLDVLIPMNGEFDGMFKHPCVEESGVTELGLNEDSDETKPAFLLVPCGFFEEHEGVPPELN